MSYLFFVSAAGLFIAAFLHLKSVEHLRLREELGEEKAEKRGRIYGAVSGTIESIALAGLWFSPQPRLVIPLFSDLAISVAVLQVPVLHLAISLPLIAAGAWFGIGGVREVGMEVAETHCSPKKIAATGVYSFVRHPQYFGWILSHLGMSVLLSAKYSMLFTPALLALIYLISRKEQDELIKELGKEYEDYMKEVPMLIPRLKRLPRAD